MILKDEEVWLLIDSGAQMSTIAISLAKMLGLKIHQLSTILEIEGSGGQEGHTWRMLKQILKNS